MNACTLWPHDSTSLLRRGSVWEEVIINCPPHIQLLCMSATVKNPDDLGNWISQASNARHACTCAGSTAPCCAPPRA